jgi:hypothetical protein
MNKTLSKKSITKIIMVGMSIFMGVMFAITGNFAFLMLWFPVFITFQRLTGKYAD